MEDYGGRVRNEQKYHHQCQTISWLSESQVHEHLSNNLPPENYYYGEEHFYFFSEAFDMLGVSGDDAVEVGRAMVCIMTNYKINLHAFPVEREKYHYYIKASDVEIAKTLMEAGISYMRKSWPVKIIVEIYTPYDWSEFSG